MRPRGGGGDDGAMLTLAVVLGLSLVLGLRHATDPDHLAAVTTLAAGSRPSPRRAGRLGLAWGAGHATSLLVLGAPIVLWRAFLPDRVQQGAEAVVGVLIIGLAVWLLSRWRRGTLGSRGRVRSQATAYGIGVVHGAGGSAGVCIVLLAAISGRWLALASLAVFAVGTCVSMAVLSAGFGRLLGAPGALRIAPAFGGLSLVFGVWYVLAAVNLV
jgi:hypothetical protein